VLGTRAEDTRGHARRPCASSPERR
jgi:hypothetical protein